jgi:prevent-host-death family protein
MKGQTTGIPASLFKARCLAILDRVARTGESILVTKHGKPVASVVPVRPRRRSSLRGSVIFKGDIVASTGEKWNATA